MGEHASKPDAPAGVVTELDRLRVENAKLRRVIDAVRCVCDLGDVDPAERNLS